MTCERCNGIFLTTDELETVMVATCSNCGSPFEIREPIRVEHLPEVPGTVLGIDVSHHNMVTDWDDVKGSGIEFAIVRVSHGIKHDRAFRDHLEGAREAGLIVGCYHYFEAADCYSNGGMPMGQARVFVEGMRMAGLVGAAGVLPPSLDIEEGTVPAGDLLLWMSDVQAETLLCPWLYTMLGWWGSHIGGDVRFGRFPLWAADWTPPLNIPPPWTDVMVWQHTNIGRVPGIVGNVDLNRFNGSLETLRWMAGL